MLFICSKLEKADFYKRFSFFTLMHEVMILGCLSGMSVTEGNILLLLYLLLLPDFLAYFWDILGAVSQLIKETSPLRSR
jgi:hypothetical protein